MGKFSIKVGIFLAPFLLLSIAAPFLPFYFYTPRTWEGMLVRRFLPDRPYYPSISLVNPHEEGILAKHTPLAIKRRVLWETDAYGYRNSPPLASRYDVVIVGDSFTVGTGLTQEDTIAQVLGKRLGMSVYSFAPGDMNSYLRDERFKGAGAPDVVIVAKVAESMRGLPALEPAVEGGVSRLKKELYEAQTEHSAFTKASIYLDQIAKTPWIFAARAWVERSTIELFRKAPLPPEIISTTDGRQYLYEISARDVLEDNDLPQLSTIVSHLKSYQETLKGTGIKLVFLPIPSPTLIHYDDLPKPYQTGRPEFYERLVEATAKEGLDTINLYPSFMAARAKDVGVYQKDDDHWSAEGVEIAVTQLAPQLRGLFQKKVSALELAP